MNETEVSTSLPRDVVGILQSLRLEDGKVVVGGSRDVSIGDPDAQGVRIFEPVLTKMTLAGWDPNGNLVSVTVSLPDQTAEIIDLGNGGRAYRFTIGVEQLSV